MIKIDLYDTRDVVTGDTTSCINRPPHPALITDN